MIGKATVMVKLSRLGCFIHFKMTLKGREKQMLEIMLSAASDELWYTQCDVVMKARFQLIDSFCS